MKFYKETNFRETPVDRFPRDWDIKKLDDICEKVRAGGTPLTSKKEYWNGNLPFVKIEDITFAGKYLTTTKNFISKEGLNNSNAWLVPENSLLLAMYGSMGEVSINKIPVTTNQAILGIIPQDRDDVEFLYYWYSFFKPRWKKYAKPTTQANLTAEIVRNSIIPMPPKMERRAIVEILGVVDSVIAKTDEVIAKTERLKKGLMQTLLTRGIGHKEFKYSEELGFEIPKEWKIEKLGNIAEFKNGINFTKKQKGDKGVLTVDVLNMYGESIYVDLENLYRVNISLEDMPEYLLKKGDILFVRSSLKREGVGWVSLFNEWNEPVTFCGFIIRARLKTTIILPEFLTYFLRSDTSRNRLIASSGQVAVTNVTQELLKILRIPLPPLEEQKEIVQILSIIDKKLEFERKERARLERIKRGLMDLLLTGKIRVKVD